MWGAFWSSRLLSQRVLTYLSSKIHTIWIVGPGAILGTHSEKELEVQLPHADKMLVLKNTKGSLLVLKTRTSVPRLQNGG